MESRVLLGIYFILILLLFIVQLVLAVLSVAVVASTSFQSQWQNMTLDPSSVNNTMLGDLQTNLKCCGDGWDAKPRAGMTCTADELKANVGCVQALFDLLKTAGLTLAIVAFVGIAVQLIAMCCSCCLMCAVGKDY